MRKLIATAATTTLLLGASAGIAASPANAGGWSYGSYGSCTVQSGSQKGKKGYKEYYNGRATGRCVLQ